MFRQVGIVVVAATFFATALALPATSHAREGAVAPAASSTATPVDASAQKVRRAARKPAVRRMAAVATPAPYYHQCFLFTCSSSGRPFPWLVLGVAY
jgi:hypothetical protein